MITPPQQGVVVGTPAQAYIGQPSSVFGQRVGVFASMFIEKGTLMGPYTGSRLSPWQVDPCSQERDETVDSNHLWEVAGGDGRQLSHFIGIRCLDPRNWITLVNCARHPAEQNLEVIQIGWNIYYGASKNILPNEELLVWYGDSTELFFGIPMFGDCSDTCKSSKPAMRSYPVPENKQLQARDQPGAELLTGSCSTAEDMSLPTAKVYNIAHADVTMQTFSINTSKKMEDTSGVVSQGVRLPAAKRMLSFALSDCVQCSVCSRRFNTRSNLRSHMRIHTLEKPFACCFCRKGFSQSSTLRNHLRLHTGEKPYRCFECDSSYSQLAGLRAHQKSARHKIRNAVGFVS